MTFNFKFCFLADSLWEKGNIILVAELKKGTGFWLQLKFPIEKILNFPTASSDAKMKTGPDPISLYTVRNSQWFNRYMQYHFSNLFQI